MINYKNGNVLEYKFIKPTLICHICNDHGGFGSGFAYAVLNKYPIVRQEYLSWYKKHGAYKIVNAPSDGSISIFRLGEIQAVRVSTNPDLYLVQMIAQSKPGGHDFIINGHKIHARPIRLDSLAQCLYNVGELAEKLSADIVGPMFGGGLAGANFDNEVVPVIDKCLTNNGVDITIFKL